MVWAEGGGRVLGGLTVRRLGGMSQQFMVGVGQQS